MQIPELQQLAFKYQDNLDDLSAVLSVRCGLDRTEYISVRWHPTPEKIGFNDVLVSAIEFINSYGDSSEICALVLGHGSKHLIKKYKKIQMHFFTAITCFMVITEAALHC